MKTMVVDNFFDNFSAIKDEFKKIPRYTADKHPSEDNEWDGERSGYLVDSDKFLINLFINEFNFWFGNFFGEKLYLHIFTHLLTKKSKKMAIHKDSVFPAYATYSMLVYLSDTNLKSGTALYDPRGKDIITDIKFVQNRAVVYDSRYFHAATGNYGDNEDNGRLTLNAFWFKPENYFIEANPAEMAAAMANEKERKNR